MPAQPTSNIPPENAGVAVAEMRQKTTLRPSRMTAADVSLLKDSLAPRDGFRI